jgi:hypothetical protein
MAVALLPDEESNGLLLFYLVRFPDSPLKNVLCLARSEDGHVWTKPDCGDGTNIVMHSSGNDVGWGEFMPTMILKDNQEVDAEQRWKMVYWERPDPSMPPGICLAVSADAKEWKPLFDRPIITSSNDAMSMVDAIPGKKTCFEEGQFLIYQQTFKHDPGLPTERDNLKGMRREISLWTCRDWKKGWWVGPITVLAPDEKDAPDLQFYWLTPFKTPDGALGGLINCHHTANQTMDVQLVSSQDGWTWSRENNRHPVLELGAQGRFDCGMVMAVAQPVMWRGRILLCYNGRATVHDGKPYYQDEPLPDPAHGIGLAEFSEKLMKFTETTCRL